MDTFNILSLEDSSLLEIIEIDSEVADGSLLGLLVSTISDEFKEQSLIIQMNSSENERIFEDYVLNYVEPTIDEIDSSI